MANSGGGLRVTCTLKWRDWSFSQTLRSYSVLLTDSTGTSARAACTVT